MVIKPGGTRPAAKKSSTGLVVGIVCGVILLSIGAGLLGMQALKGQAQKRVDSTFCIMNAKQLGLAALMFSNDHNGTLPDASRWVEQLKPYYKDPKLLRCPGDTSGAVSSFAMNSALSGQNVDANANRVLFFETANPGACPSGGIADVPNPSRHEKGNTFVTANGIGKCLPTPPPF
jgi:hypothetical protein